MLLDYNDYIWLGGEWSEDAAEKGQGTAENKLGGL